ncbi:protein kinase [Nocardia sp. NPDC056100]|uniref:protein kinase domain-containing protein n=1 Tax=Nocardia sp. NPDC056100 TaxID=3345712 RepID=UPI0035D6F1ED
MLNNGDVFAGFTIERMLGQGGMGSVFLARHPRLGRLTALKLLNRELFADREIRARFEREADLVAQLDHPNIVEVYDRGTEDEQLWISMQFIDGVDAAGVNVTQLPPERAVQIIEGVADALDYAHARGVLHRDVKPANIILARAVAGHGERVFLTDFGIARLREDSTHLTQRGMFTATLAYASPEQMTGGHLDHTTDQYSLACALYWLLIGAGPYDSPHPGELIRGHLQLLPPPVSLRRPGLTQAMDAVLTKAMAKRPADRFPSCSDFAKAARHALTNTTPIHPGTPYTVAPPIYGAPPVGAYPAPPGYAPAPNYPPQQPPGYPPAPQQGQSPGAAPIAPQPYSPAAQPPSPVPAAPQPYPAPQQPGAQPGQAYSPAPQPGAAPAQAYPPAQQPPGVPNYQVPQQPPAQPGADQAVPLDDSAFRPTDSFPTHRPPTDSPSPDSSAEDAHVADALSTRPTDSYPTRRDPSSSSGAAPATSAPAQHDSSEPWTVERHPAAAAQPGAQASDPKGASGGETALAPDSSGSTDESSTVVDSTSGATSPGVGSGGAVPSSEVEAPDSSPESVREGASDSESEADSTTPGATDAGTAKPSGSSGYPDAAQRNPESGAFVPSTGGGATPPSQPVAVSDPPDPDRVWARPGTAAPPSEPAQTSDPGVVSPVEPARSPEPTRSPESGPVPPAPAFAPPGYPMNSAPPQQVPDRVGRSQLTALVVLGLAALALLLMLAFVVIQVAG